MPTDEERMLSVALARLEGKLDSLISLHKRQSEDLDDHERRIRDVEGSLHGLATKADIEQIEAKRQRKTMAWAAIFVSLIVPLEAAIIAAVIQGLGK